MDVNQRAQYWAQRFNALETQATGHFSLPHNRLKKNDPLVALFCEAHNAVEAMVVNTTDATVDTAEAAVRAFGDTFTEHSRFLKAVGGSASASPSSAPTPAPVDYGSMSTDELLRLALVGHLKPATAAPTRRFGFGRGGNGATRAHAGRRVL